MRKCSMLVLTLAVTLVMAVAVPVEARNLLSKLQQKGNEDVASPSDVPVPKPMSESVLKNSPTPAILPVSAAEPILVPAPAPVGDCNVCKDRCIKYKHHCTLRKTCCRCDQDVKTVLAVKDPCCCCTVDVTICKPGCCTDEPKVCVHDGVFGRNVVEYEWCCGFRVKVIFDRCGDVTVHTYGR